MMNSNEQDYKSCITLSTLPLNLIKEEKSSVIVEKGWRFDIRYAQIVEMFWLLME